MAWGVSASHIPVLISLNSHWNIKRVLEIGSGELSTKLFLNTLCFPRLTSLVSVEDDPEWIDKLKLKDHRLEWRSTVPAALYDYDLIFVDGPQDEEKRVKTIHYVMREVVPAVIVIHDIENKLYRAAVNQAYYSYIFRFVMSPQTAIYAREELPKATFKRHNGLMKKHFDDVQEDAARWQVLLGQGDLL